MNINKLALVLANGDEEIAEIKAYYIRSMVHTGTTLTAILLASYVFDVLQYSMIIILTLRLVRTKTGGCHSRSITLCKIYSFVMVLGLGLLVPIIKITQMNLIIWSSLVLIFGLYMIHKVVPLDSPQRPIISQEFRRELKTKAYIFFLLLMASIYIFSVYHYLEEGVAILLALSLQLFLMTKIGYWVIAKFDYVFNVR